MKKLLLLLTIVCAFASCEDIQDNNPALQAEIDDVFFKSIGSVAAVNQDNTVTIQASTQDETLTLFLEREGDSLFTLGGENVSFASFEDAFGNSYITNPEGSGSVVISDYQPGRFISGSFNFVATNPGIDTLTVQKGIFFEVPFVTDVDVPAGPDPNIPDGTFVAELNGEVFEVSDVQTSVNGSVLVIDGIMGDQIIRIIVSLSATAGSYAIPGGGYFADYINGSQTEGAQDGNIRVFEHDTAAMTMKATFSFTTQNNLITRGQFNVSY